MAIADVDHSAENRSGWRMTGPNVNAEDDDRLLVLMWASDGGFIEIVRVLN